MTKIGARKSKQGLDGKVDPEYFNGLISRFSGITSTSTRFKRKKLFGEKKLKNCSEMRFTMDLADPNSIQWRK